VLRRGVHGGDGLVERMLGEMARAVGAPADVVEVDGKVEGDAEARRVPRRERAKRVLVRRLVRLERELRGALALLTPREFREIPVVVALPVPRPRARSRSGRNGWREGRGKRRGRGTCILR